MSGDAAMPERIGRFRIQSMLGRGAMGVVYLGHDEEIDRLVAIKLIRADLLDTDERESYLRRFRNEAKIAGRCVHANIVGLYDFAVYDGNPYLVMEYVDGVGLQQFYPRGSRRSIPEVVNIALQVLDALHYAHSRSIVHRDIKPANILMMPDATLKITDFGISRLTSMELTATPVLIGTPSYMSPEQCIGSALDGRNDLFSLGCVLYELVAGERAFTGANYTQTLFSIVNRPHVPLRQLREDLPPGFSDAIDRALAKSPDERFADASTFAQTLDEIARNAGLERTNVPSVMTASLRTVPAPLREDAASEIADPHAVPETVAIPMPTILSALPPEQQAAVRTAGDAPLPGEDATLVHRAQVREPARDEAPPPEPVGLAEEPGSRPNEAPIAMPVAAVGEADGVRPAAAGAAETLAPAHEAPFPARDQAPPGTPDDADADADADRERGTPPDAVPAAVLPVGQAERAHLSRCLAEVIGPIAPLLMRRVEHPDMDVGTLTRRLAEFIHHADERTTFMTLTGRDRRVTDGERR